MKKIFLFSTILTSLFILFSFESYSMHPSFAVRKTLINHVVKIKQNWQTKEAIKGTDKSCLFDLQREMHNTLYDIYEGLDDLSKNREAIINKITFDNWLPTKNTGIILNNITVPIEIAYADAIDPDWKILIGRIFRIG